MRQGKRSPDEHPPPIIDFVMSQSLFGGFMVMLGGVCFAAFSPILCLVPLLLVSRPLPFDWYWPAGVTFFFGIVFIAAGALLQLMGALIARWWWGVSLREVFFGSPPETPDSN
jgi:hypothetical protein